MTRADSSMPPPQTPAAATAPVRRGRGRPPGARTRHLAAVRLLLQEYPTSAYQAIAAEAGVRVRYVMETAVRYRLMGLGRPDFSSIRTRQILNVIENTDLDYAMIGREFGMTRERVRQIAKKFAARQP